MWKKLLYFEEEESKVLRVTRSHSHQSPPFRLLSAWFLVTNCTAAMPYIYLPAYMKDV